MLLALILSRGIMACRQLLMVPVFLGFWGPERFGEWLMLTSIPSFMAMSNLGLGTSASLQIANELAAGKPSEASQTFFTSMVSLVALICAASLALGALLCTGLVSLFDRFGQIQNPAVVFACMLLIVFIRVLSMPARGFWVGTFRASTPSQWRNSLAISELLVSVAVVLLGGGALQLAVCLFICNCVWVSAFAFAVVTVLPKPSKKNKRLKFDYGTARKLLSSGVGHQLSPLWQALYFQGMLLLAGGMLGPAVAALWGSLRIIGRFGNQLLEIVSQTLSPEFQTSHGSNDMDLLRRLYATGIVFSLSVSTICAAILVVVGKTFFLLWTQNKFEFPVVAWVLMSLSLIPYSLWWLSGELQRSLNMPWKVNLIATLAALATLGFAYGLAGLGITGLALATLFFDVFLALTILPSSIRLLRVRWSAIADMGFRELARIAHRVAYR